MKKLALVFAIACFAATFFAQEAPRSGKGKAPGQDDLKHRQRQSGQAMSLERIKKDAEGLIAMYDKDGDGKINEEEAGTFKKDYAVFKKLQKFNRSLNILEQIDKNNNLIIEPEEAKGLRDAMARMRPAGGQRPNGRQGSNDGQPKSRGDRPAPKTAE